MNPLTREIADANLLSLNDKCIAGTNGSESRNYLRSGTQALCAPPVTPKHFRQPGRTIKNAYGALRG